MALGLALLPDFGRAASLELQHDLLIEMTLDIQRTRARHLRHIHAPQALGSIKLDVGAAPAQPLPWRHRQVLNAHGTDAAIDRHALIFHESVIGQFRPLESAKAGVLTRLRFVPMGVLHRVMHRTPIASAKAARYPDES